MNAYEFLCICAATLVTNGVIFGSCAAWIVASSRAHAALEQEGFDVLTKQLRESEARIAQMLEQHGGPEGRFDS